MTNWIRVHEGYSAEPSPPPHFDDFPALNTEQFEFRWLIDRIDVRLVTNPEASRSWTYNDLLARGTSALALEVEAWAAEVLAYVAQVANPRYPQEPRRQGR